VRLPQGFRETPQASVGGFSDSNGGCCFHLLRPLGEDRLFRARLYVWPERGQVTESGLKATAAHSPPWTERRLWTAAASGSATPLWLRAERLQELTTADDGNRRPLLRLRRKPKPAHGGSWPPQSKIVPRNPALTFGSLWDVSLCVVFPGLNLGITV
jgi:hypothetical protein